MSLSDDPWELPSATAFLGELKDAVATGGAMIIGGPSMPWGLDAAVARHFCDQGFIVDRIDACSAGEPAEALATAFGTTAEARALGLATQLADHLAVIVSGEGSGAFLNSWQIFLARFLKVRAGQTGGLAILLLPQAGVVGTDSVPLVAWNGRLRRIDVTIWADLHAPLDRPEPLATLAAALAVELCGWRLDLAAEIAQARREDILNPMGWLQRQIGQAASAPCRLNGHEMDCPIVLLERGQLDEINRRIWRAELAALFPWIEARRQGVITRYRKRLRLDVHLRSLGVLDEEEMEFGALAWQLRNQVGRTEGELLDCFTRLRNRLAHGSPVDPADLDRVLREARNW